MMSESEYHTAPTIFLRPEEFAQDAETKLGRANGNTYQRKPGLDDVHDGQIMVRLKKKRFIIIDYGHVPSEHDHEIAKAVPHINIPNGGGITACATKTCSRVGVPVLLYDSEPNEPMSLYLRGGLCFSCQRNLNEKRRTQRKRKSDGYPVGEARTGGDMPSLDMGPGTSNSNRFKFNDHILELNPDAVVINGPVDGARVRGPGYRCPEIGTDLLRIVSELSHETLSLMQHSSGVQSGMVSQNVNVTASSVNAMYQKAFLSVSKATFLLTQWKASWDEHVAANMAQNAAAEAAAASTNFDSRVLGEAAASQAMIGEDPSRSHHSFPDQLGYLGNSPGASVGGNAQTMQPLMMPSSLMRDAGQSNNDHIERS